MKRCHHCKLLYQDGNEFCARCGNGLTRSPIARGDSRTLLAVVIGVVVLASILLWVGVVVEHSSSRSLSPSATARRDMTPVSSPSSRTKSAEVNTPDFQPPTREEATTQALNSFREKLMSVPESERIILSVQGSEVPGVARVHVSNIWFNAEPYQRRQLTHMMANLWRGEMAGKTAILHIYDITGREIAGTRALGGVWTEDE